MSGRVSMKPQLRFFYLAFPLFLAGCGATSRGPSLKTLYTDYLANQDVKKEKFEDALAKYYLILEDEGQRSGTHSNIGVILNAVQKPDEALKSLQHALKLAEAEESPEMIFKVRYNLGVYYGAQKKISEALENYQAALDLAPTSNEVKTNIELLIQKQQQDQKNKNGQNDKDSKENPQKGGQGENQDKKPSDEGKDQKDEKKDQKVGQEKKEDQKKAGSPKYQPRPFKGDQLSEGDVKKILGELKNQEQKIRANFDKKEKGKSKSNEKNW